MRFHEQQRFRQPWLWALLVGGVAPAIALKLYGYHRYFLWLGQDEFVSEKYGWYGFVATAAFAVIIYGGVVGVIAAARLDVTVTDDAVVIRFRPFHRTDRRIALADIEEVYARTYSALREFGGWGIRMTSQGTAYNVSGSEGVQLVLTDGKRILIGSGRSKELEAAITSARRSP